MFRRLLILTILPLISSVAMAHGSAGTSPARLPGMHTVRALSGDQNLMTQNGEDIRVYSFEYRDPNGLRLKAKHRFLVEGGLHGNELLTSDFVVWLARRYARGQSALNKLAKHRIAIDFVPQANPDGHRAETRYNAKGVNLNRNFGMLWGISRENPGPKQFSEPETRAIKFLFEKYRYTAAVDVHGYINWVVAPSSPQVLETLGATVDKSRAAEYEQWSKALQKELSLLPGYRFKTAGGLGDGGAFEDWAFWGAGTMGYCLELKSPERYANPYRRPFGNIAKEEDNYKVDLFLKYEEHIFRMFSHAVAIRGDQEPGQLAKTPKTSLGGTQGTH